MVLCPVCTNQQFVNSDVSVYGDVMMLAVLCGREDNLVSEVVANSDRERSKSCTR